MWSNKLACVLILATVTVNGTKYTISNETTDWNNTSCKLAVPDLKYAQGKGWHIDEQHLSQLNISSDGVWIGYINATVAFEYLGCLQVTDPVNTHLMNNIGDCNSKCKGNIFGVKEPSPSIQGVICVCNVSSDDMTAKSCTAVCDQDFICGKQNQNYFAIYNKTIVSNTTEDDPNSKKCLIFLSLKSSFEWHTCRFAGTPRLLCSIKNADGQWVAYSSDSFSPSWEEANIKCLSNKTLPATINSIFKGTIYASNQRHWTGVIRTHTVLKADDRDLITRPGTATTYSFMTDSGQIQFERSGNRSSLCTVSAAATTTPTFNFSTTMQQVEETEITSTSPSNTSHVSSTRSDSTHTQSSTSHEELEQFDETSEKSSESTPLGIGIGISVVIICSVGATITIIMLKKRGILACKFGADKEQPAEGESAFEEEMACKKSLDDTVANHNYFILEKGSQSVNENIDNYNSARESNDDNGEDGIYNLIEDTDEPYKYSKDKNGEYDYTTNVLTSGSNTGNPDNVYNKLKLNRLGDFDLVGRHEHNVSQAGNDYDTTSTAFAPSNADVSDYNHIPHPVEGNGNKDREHGAYDVNEGRMLKLAPSDASGYAHVKI